MEAAWPSIDPSEYKRCWAVDGLCEHLEAVTKGQIRRLLVNMPPRTGKTTVTSICWPAWAWARREITYWSGPQVRFLFGSYGQKLSLENSNKTRRLIGSPWYQERWRSAVQIRDDQNSKEQFDLVAGGSRSAVSVGSSLLGLGGDILGVDDPHNLEDVESETGLENARNWFAEFRSTRINDPKRGALVVNMQRLAENDLSGVICSGEDYTDWVHYMVPMEYDTDRHCVTVLKWDQAGKPEETWEDPRTEDGELMWPDRVGPKELASLKRDLGDYMASGRLQQSPAPRGGGIFKTEWWQVWESQDGKFPMFDLLIASVDSAFTTNEQNDPTGMTVWGVFSHEGNRRLMLVNAWRKHLAFSGPRVAYEPGESKAQWQRRTQPTWGLMEWIQYTCERFNVDKLLIEAKASGISAAQELRNRYGRQDWSTQLCPVKGDKVARALGVQATFSQLGVYAPVRDWSDLVIQEMAVFPAGKYDDLTDSTTQAVKYLRDIGMAPTDEEVKAEEAEWVMHKPQPKALYPV